MIFFSFFFFFEDGGDARVSDRFNTFYTGLYFLLFCENLQFYRFWSHPSFFTIKGYRQQTSYHLFFFFFFASSLPSHSWIKWMSKYDWSLRRKGGKRFAPLPSCAAPSSQRNARSAYYPMLSCYTFEIQRNLCCRDRLPHELPVIQKEFVSLSVATASLKFFAIWQPVSQTYAAFVFLPFTYLKDINWTNKLWFYTLKSST